MDEGAIARAAVREQKDAAHYNRLAELSTAARDEKLRKLAQAGWTQQELANLVGLSPSRMVHILKEDK